jgi:hypothetical protein
MPDLPVSGTLSNMHQFSVAAIINFCTTEARFLKACIEQVRYFAHQIIIPVCDHFFDGKPENRALLEQIYRSFPDCLFVEFPYLPNKSPAYLASVSRMVGTQFLHDEIDRLFFVDADEIPEGKKIVSWFNSSDWAQYSVLKLASYWYFREPRYRAQQWEDAILFVQRKTLDASLLLHERERAAIYDALPGPKKCMVTGSDGTPLCHHFSWVRTKQELLKKVTSWGHRKDRNWVDLVEQEYSGPFRGTDFVHGYSYQEIDPPPFAISLGEVSFPGNAESRMIRLSFHELLKMMDVGPLDALKNWVHRWVFRARKGSF